MTNNELAEYRESVRPATNSNADQYTMTVTGQMETSRGIAWTAALNRNGNRIGTVEDHGDGGYPHIHINDPAEQQIWNTTIAAAYPDSDMGEENLLAHLDFLSEGL